MAQKQSFLEWLAELTHLGHSADPYLIIATKDAKLIEGYYKGGKTIQEAFELYKKYRHSNA